MIRRLQAFGVAVAMGTVAFFGHGLIICHEWICG